MVCSTLDSSRRELCDSLLAARSRRPSRISAESALLLLKTANGLRMAGSRCIQLCCIRHRIASQCSRIHPGLGSSMNLVPMNRCPGPDDQSRAVWSDLCTTLGPELLDRVQPQLESLPKLPRSRIFDRTQLG